MTFIVPASARRAVVPPKLYSKLQKLTGQSRAAARKLAARAFTLPEIVVRKSRGGLSTKARQSQREQRLRTRRDRVTLRLSPGRYQATYRVEIKVRFQGEDLSLGYTKVAPALDNTLPVPTPAPET